MYSEATRKKFSMGKCVQQVGLQEYKQEVYQSLYRTLLKEKSEVSFSKAEYGAQFTNTFFFCSFAKLVQFCTKNE